MKRSIKKLLSKSWRGKDGCPRLFVVACSFSRYPEDNPDKTVFPTLTFCKDRKGPTSVEFAIMWWDIVLLSVHYWKVLNTSE